MAKTLSLQDGPNLLKFRISKLPATKAEAWLLHALALVGSGLDGGDAVNAAGLLAAIGKAPFAESKALLDELLSCVEKVNSDGSTIAVDLSDADGYISSPLTLLRLRKEALAENFGFLASGGAFGFLAGESSAPTA